MGKPGASAFHGKGKKRQAEKSERRELQQGMELIRSLSKIVPWSVQVLLESETITTWGGIKQENMRATYGSLLLNHGPQLQGTWYMLAIVDAVSGPDSPSLSSSAPDIVRGLLDAGSGIQSAFGRPSNYAGVTPLLIFRKLGGS